MVKYNEFLADCVREKLLDFADVEEKFMFNCLAFLLNQKLFAGIKEHEMFVRINPDEVENVIERNGCRQMMHGKIKMKGYLMIEEEVLQNPREFNFWFNLALAYNPLAKSSKAGK